MASVSGSPSAAVGQVFSQALSLSPAEREELAHLLFESLPEGDDAPLVVSEEWEQEIERRLADIRSGQAKTSTVQEVMQDLRSILERPAK